MPGALPGLHGVRSTALLRPEEPDLDLHFTPFDRACEVTLLPADLAVLMVGIAERQAASATARAQARLWAANAMIFRPIDGAFHAAMAARVVRWRHEEPVYLAVSADLQAGSILPVTDSDGAAPPEGQR